MKSIIYLFGTVKNSTCCILGVTIVSMKKNKRRKVTNVNKISVEQVVKCVGKY